MADENNTKAPDTDPNETPQDSQPIIPGDTPAQTGPTMGDHEHCVTDRPAPSGQASTGEIIKLNDIDVYISKPADYPHTSAKLLLLLTNGTGIKSVNNQIQADRFATEGFLVLMPDIFGGDVAPGIQITEDSSSILEQFKLKAAEVTKSFMIDMWLARITPDKVLPILHKVIDAAKGQYADAVKYGDGIYAVGYCVGGRFVLYLAKETQAAESADEEAGGAKTGPYIKAGAVAHGASVQPEDFEGVSVPLTLVCVEDDPLFSEEVRKAGEDIMSKANLEHEVQVYPGVPHGFAVVGEYGDDAIQDAQATAYEQMLKWIKEH